MPFFPLYLTCLPIFLVCGACGVPAFAYIAWRQRYAPLQCLPRFSLLTCKQYRAMDGGLAACRRAERFCNPKKIHGWIFLGKAPPVPAAFSFACQAVPSHVWRLSSMQKCKALLFNKCFFGGKFPSTGSGNVVCLLPCAPLCPPPLAFSVRTLPVLIEGAASPRMEPNGGDEGHVRSDYPREKW